MIYLKWSRKLWIFSEKTSSVQIVDDNRNQDHPWHCHPYPVGELSKKKLSTDRGERRHRLDNFPMKLGHKDGN